MSVKIELQTVSERTVTLVDPRFRSNAAAVALEHFIVVVDPTMVPAAAQVFRQEVEDRFGLPVKYFLLTHYHSDHVFGAAPFADTCMIGSTDLVANILRKKADWSPEAIARWKQDNLAGGPDWLGEVEIVIPPLAFQGRLEIRDGDQVAELYHSSGHTNDSTYAYVPHEKVLFAGDLIFARMFPYAGDPTCDPDRWIATLQHFLSLDLDKFVPGHGPVIERDEVEKTLSFFEALRDATRAAVAAGKGPEEIELPEFYELDEQDAWLKKSTLEHLHGFYGGKG